MNGTEQPTQRLAHIAAEHRGLERRASQLIQLVRRPVEIFALPEARSGIGNATSGIK